MQFEGLERRRLMAAGELDPTGGSQTLGFGDLFGAVDATLALRDGRTLVAGRTSGSSLLNPHTVVARFTSALVNDTSFTGGGEAYATSDDLDRLGQIVAMRQLTGGKILLVGQFAAARLSATDATLDSSYGDSGVAAFDFGTGIEGATATDADILPDGRTIIVGTADDVAPPTGSVNLAVFLKADGSPNNSFSGDGLLTASPDDPGGFVQWDQVAFAPDGKIVIALHGHETPSDFVLGSDFAGFTRYSSAGALDIHFGADGRIFPLAGTSPQFNDLAVLPDGSAIGVGSSGTNLAIEKITSEGVPDTTFDVDGAIVTTFNKKQESSYTSIHALGDGRFYVGGVEHYHVTEVDSQVLVARYNADGSLDGTFGGNDGGGGLFRATRNGTQVETTKMAVGDNGKIVVASSGRDDATDPTIWNLLRLAGDPTIRLNSKGTLFIDGTSNDDVISFSLRNRDGRIVARLNEFAVAFAPSKIKRMAAFARAGDDSVTFGAGILRGGYAEGGDGKDTITGGVGDDILLGDAGDDQLFGNDGNDKLVGGSGNDYLLGSAGADDLFGLDGIDTLSGAGGNDRLFGGAGADIVRGGAGIDRAESSGEDDVDGSVEGTIG